MAFGCGHFSYHRTPSSSLNTLFLLLVLGVRMQLPFQLLPNIFSATLPLLLHELPLYVDITAKALGYMDVLAFYSFSRKNLISRCQRKAIFHFP